MSDDVRGLLKRELENVSGDITPTELLGRVTGSLPDDMEFGEAKEIAGDLLDEPAATDGGTAADDSPEPDPDPPAPPEAPPVPDAAVDLDDEGEAVRALDDAITWFHRRVDDIINDHTETGEHPDRPTTAREWFEDDRQFDTETVDEKRLGWVPANCGDQLVEFLLRSGHEKDAILGTGLFNEDLKLLWNGRYVFPYFDRDGRAVYAIARCTGGLGGGGGGYDGHPEDFMAGKYTKLAHTKDYVHVEEPIYGLSTIGRDGPVLITEGVADALRAHENGYACLSPVTTQFKNEHLDPLLKHLEDTGRAVYVVQDSEPAPIDFDGDLEGWGCLAIEQFGAGLKGGIRTAAVLRQEGVDAYVAELPRLAEEKVDLDDYLAEWADTLAPVLASAKPADQHPAYEDAMGKSTQATRLQDGSGNGGGEDGGGEAERNTPQHSDKTPNRDLTREEIEEALEHVSKSLHYDDWIKMGYAVHDWGGDETGREVFTEWSKRSPKWEKPTSSDAIDWIWRNASGSEEIAGKRRATTVGTLIHYAQRDDDYTPPWERDPDWPVFDVVKSAGIELHLLPINGKQVKVAIEQNGTRAYSEEQERGFWNNGTKRGRIAGRIADVVTGAKPDSIRDGVKSALNQASVDAHENEDEWEAAMRSPREKGLRQRTVKVVCYPAADEAEWVVTMHPPEDSSVDGPRDITFDQGDFNDANAGTFRNKHLATFYKKIEIDAEEWFDLVEYWLNIQDTKERDPDHLKDAAIDKFLDWAGTMQVWADEEGFSWSSRNGYYWPEFDGDDDAICIPGQKVVEWQQREDFDDVNLSKALREEEILIKPSQKRTINGEQRRFWPISADVTPHTLESAHEVVDDDDDEKPEGLR